MAKVIENRPSQKLVIGKGYSVSVPFPLGKIRKLETKLFFLINFFNSWPEKHSHESDSNEK